MLEVLSRVDVKSAPRELLEALLVALASKQAEIAVQLAVSSNRAESVKLQHDELLDVEQAARRLGVKPDWVYKRAAKLPFTVRLGERKLRFSAKAIETYIRRHRAN